MVVQVKRANKSYSFIVTIKTTNSREVKRVKISFIPNFKCLEVPESCTLKSALPFSAVPYLSKNISTHRSR